jgi:hypothetical protein
MKKRLFVGCVAPVMIFCAAPVLAGTGDFGIGVKAGSLGAGAELSKAFSDKFSIGLGINSYNYKTARTESNVDYDFKFELQSVSLLGSYHPFGGAFRLTGGVLYNNNELKLDGKPSAGSTYDINGVTYTASQVGTLTGKLTFNKTAPYLGVGWGNRPGSKFGLSADIGVLYQGAPNLALSATGALSDPALASDLEQERKSTESDLSGLKWYPVLSVGLYFRF